MDGGKKNLRKCYTISNTIGRADSIVEGTFQEFRARGPRVPHKLFLHPSPPSTTYPQPFRSLIAVIASATQRRYIENSARAEAASLPSSAFVFNYSSPRRVSPPWSRETGENGVVKRRERESKRRRYIRHNDLAKVSNTSLSSFILSVSRLVSNFR